MSIGDEAGHQRMTAYLDECRKIIKKSGWLVQGVFSTPEEPGPNFAYTAGLTALDHPELIIFGLPHKLCATILNSIGERVQVNGTRYLAGHTLANVISRYPLHVASVDDSTTHLTVANTLFPDRRPVPALQVVWPDDESRFPWDEGYAVDQEVQPLLGTP